MKKRELLKASLAVAAAMVVMTGCGNSDTAATTAGAAETTVASEETTVASEETTGGSEETSDYEPKSAEELVDEAKIVLGDYKELPRTITKTEITEDTVANELAYLALMYLPEITDRPAQLGDVANIDYTGYDGDVAFDGGTATGYDLELGSNTFIDGFEDGIVGMNIGEERDLNLKFPEEYHSEDLAGKEVVFHVKLNKLTNEEDAIVDDALAKRILGDENATLEQLSEDVKADLELQAEYDYYVNAGAEVLTQLVAISEITVDPDAAEQMHYQMTSTYKAQAEMYGFAYEDFLSYFLGMTPEELEMYAESIVKQEMVLNELIAKENLSATDEQKDMIAQMNGFADAKSLLEQIDAEAAESAFNMGAANYFLLENSVLAE